MKERARDPSGMLDLTHLVQEVDRPTPPSLVDDPSRLWPSLSGLHSSLLSTTIAPGTAESWQSLVEELADESHRCKDEALRGALLCEAGRILIDWLGRQEEGELLLRRSGSPIADVVLRTRDGDTSSLAGELAVLEREATDANASPHDRAAAWIEFGMLCEERTPSRGRALDAYRAALALVPDHPVASTLAAQAALLEGEGEAAAAYLRDLVARTQSTEYRVALLLDLAELAPDPDEQLIILEQARQARPHEETVLRRLSRTLAAIGDLEHLGELYRELALLAEDPISASTALHLAFLTLVDADRPVDDLVRELARRIPERADSTDVLAPLAEVALFAERQWALGSSATPMRENEAILERLASALDDPREQGLVREQLARLRLQRLRVEAPPASESGTQLKLSDPQLALADLLEADLRFCLVHLPEHRWVQEALAEVLEVRSSLPALVVHLQEWARTESAGPSRAAVLRRLGRVHESKRKDLPRAAEIYELAVAEDPNDPSCLRALGRIYEKMRRWPQAVATLRRQASESDDVPERLAALRRVAQLAENELGDIDLAIASLEEVAKLDPDDLLSLYQLARLCRVGRRPTVLIHALEQLTERVDDEIAQTALLVELGEVLELHLKQRDKARASYQRALHLTPGYTPALQALARLYRDGGELDELVGLLDPEVDPVSDPAVLALKAGRVCFEEVGDPERAIAHFQAAYASNPDLLPARELLLSLLTATGRVREAYDLLRAQDLPRSEAMAADTHYRLGLLAEAAARQAGTSREQPSALENAALQHHRAALARQPDHGLAFERARRLLVAFHDIDNLVHLIDAVLSAEPEHAQAVHHVQLARLRIGSGDPVVARRSYENALALAPNDAIIRHELEGLLRLLGDRKSLPALYLRSAQSTADTHLEATLRVEAAELLLSTGQTEDQELAGKAILEALRVDPGNPYAVRHLERLLSDPDSPFVVKDAVSARAVRAQSDAERAIFYVESAELLERVGAWGQARRAYVAAKGALPNLAPADLGLQRTGSEHRRAPVSPSGRASVHVLLAEARDATARAAQGDAAAREQALQAVREVLGRDPQHRDALTLARSLATQPGDPKPIVDLLTQAFGAVEEAELRYEIGLFLGEHAKSQEEAVRYFEAASAARPSGRRALRGLVTSYRQLGDDQRAAEATERLLDLFEPGEPSAVDLRMGLATFLGTRPEALSRALEHARIILAARPSDTRALGLMADLLERSNRRGDAAKVLDRLASRERSRERLHDIFLRKAKLLADDPAASGEALKAIERAAALNPGNRDTITMLVDQLSAAGQTTRVATYLPPIRNALQVNVGRGAVSLRDLRLLAKVAAPRSPDLAEIAHRLVDAIDGAPSSVAGTPSRATTTGLRRILADKELRKTTFDPGEPPALFELLQALEVSVARMTRDFPGIANIDSGAPPPEIEAAGLHDHARHMAEIAGLRVPRLATSATHNAVLLVQDPICTVRLGNNLWSQHDPPAWRGLVTVAMARAMLGAPRTRALAPPNLDLLLSACFELTSVFNPTTADPDPTKLRDVVAGLRNLLARRARQAVEEACQALASHAFDAGATARATLGTDLRFAALISGEYGDCLAAACLLDGVIGGTFKQRVARSRAARELLVYLISDDFLQARRVASTA